MGDVDTFFNKMTWKKHLQDKAKEVFRLAYEGCLLRRMNKTAHVED